MAAPTRADYRTRVAQQIFDTANAYWSTTAIDEALRTALQEYSQAYPSEVVANLTLSATSLEISLASLTGLISVHNAIWPYTSTDPLYNLLDSYKLDRRAAGNFLLITPQQGAGYPVANQLLRLWYGTAHTIQDIDSAASTSHPEDHYNILTYGTCGHALNMRSIDIAGEFNIDTRAAERLYSAGVQWRAQFAANLSALRAQRTSNFGKVSSGGWKMDKWDA